MLTMISMFSGYSASRDADDLINRAALTKMGETGQQFTSSIAVGQAQGDDGSE